MNLIKFEKPISIVDFSAVGGREEKRGRLKEGFDFFDERDTFGQKTWELAEAEMARVALNIAIKKAEISHDDIAVLVGGDLQNQCVATSLGLSSFGIPYFGIYGACSTCTEGLIILSSILSLMGEEKMGAAVTSSHNSAAERQFRTPVEYGGQRKGSAQWTATAAGAFILSNKEGAGRIKIVEAMPGRIVDGATADAANMGAAMAFAAADTIINYFEISGKNPVDFDYIVTGDLGRVGTNILTEILEDKLPSASSRHIDCGNLLYDSKKQDMHSGASGCGTSASVLASYFLPRMISGEIKRILLLSTGALMSPTSVMQGQNIYGIAPLIHISAEEKNAL